MSHVPDNEKNGIPMPPALLDALGKLAGELGISPLA